MKQNYRVVCTAKSQVSVEPCAMPEIGDNAVLMETEVSQISIGTELTMIEANVEPNTPWSKDIESTGYPFYPGYACVGKIVVIGKNVPTEYLGKRLMTFKSHQKYHTIELDDYQNILFVPDGVSAAEASLGAIGQITMASIRIAGIRPGETCLVYGAGLIGQMVARYAKFAGASKVFVTDISDFRLSKLPQDPCFIPINTAREKAAEVILAANGSTGVKYAFETTSVPSLIQEQLECLVKRGTLVISSSPKGKSVVDFDYCSRMGLTIIGAHNYAVHTPTPIPADPWTRRRDTELFFELLKDKRISVSEMITHSVPWQEAPSLYNMLMEDRTRALSVNIDWEADAQ